jgi:hypothetical protein
MTTATKQKFKVTFYKESDKLSPVAQKTYGEPITLYPMGLPRGGKNSLRVVLKPRRQAVSTTRSAE